MGKVIRTNEFQQYHILILPCIRVNQTVTMLYDCSHYILFLFLLFLRQIVNHFLMKYRGIYVQPTILLTHMSNIYRELYQPKNIIHFPKQPIDQFLQKKTQKKKTPTKPKTKQQYAPAKPCTYHFILPPWKHCWRSIFSELPLCQISITTPVRFSVVKVSWHFFSWICPLM